jgi:hypothetical protein
MRSLDCGSLLSGDGGCGSCTGSRPRVEPTDNRTVPGLCFVTNSQPTIPAQYTSFLGTSSYGVLSLYIFILITIGGMTKAVLLGNAINVIYREMPEPQDLMDLCEGIYIARVQKYRGHLEDEVRLFETLMKLYRSPQMLLRMTGTNGINLLPPRENERRDINTSKQKSE